MESLSSLDLQGRNRNSFCGRWSLRGQEAEEAHWRYGRLGCKRWDCERCGPRKARQLRGAIIRKAIERDLRRFLTLTLDPRTCTPEESTAYIRDCWNKFRTYLKRRHGALVSFIAILELQKSGYAHLHVLVDRYIPQPWISEAWQSVGGGRIVFITQVDVHRVAGYLAKYLTKELLESKLHPRQRRYTTSRDIRLLTKSTSGKWVLLRRTLELLYWHTRSAVIREGRDDNGFLQWFESARVVGGV